MKSKHVCVGLGLLVILFWGCQAAQTPREKDKQAKAYIEQAQAYETQGNLVEALEQFKLAQTIDPSDAFVNQSINRLDIEVLEHMTVLDEPAKQEKHTMAIDTYICRFIEKQNMRPLKTTVKNGKKGV